MMWRLWQRRGRRLDLMPAGGVNGREQAARDALRATEHKAAMTDRLTRRAERLAAEVQRALGVGP